MGCITDVPGVLVGHWEDLTARTGCTVIRFPHDNTAGVEVRGAAPASRELDLLRPGMSVRRADAVLLTGGSAFGLGAAQGVVDGLLAEGRGQPTPTGPVPIVPAAGIFDRMIGDITAAPGPAEGRAAFDAASSDPVEDRRSGAGAGATVGKWRGGLVDAGIGSGSRQAGAATVGALVVLNAVGDVYLPDGSSTSGGDGTLAPPIWAMSDEVPFEANTTLIVVATDAPAAEVDRMAIRAQDALAAVVRPAHTRYDGDVAIAVARGEGPIADADLLQEAAFHATIDAIYACMEG
ncbi:MAG: P1 family peptidase [Acidimicrobiia bacterium]|nr:P1 family peptidase [Acidimicrobiia bacterium]